MTTENQAVEQVEVQEEVKLSPVQQKAMDQGWKPKEQFEGDPDDFIDAPEFVRRGELFDKIERQSKELRNVKDALEAFKVHHTKVKESEYNRALKAVEAARKKAFEDGDSDRFFALEQQIDAIKDEAAAVKEAGKAPIEPTTPPALETWMSQNAWYQKDRAMTAFADSLGAELHAKGFTLEQALREIDAEVRKEFASKLERKRPPSPEGSTRTSAGSKADSFKLSDEEARVMNKLVKSGVMSKEDYIKDLKAVKGE
jgi:hypothetical protein